MKCDRCAIRDGFISIPTRKRSLIGNRPITPIKVCEKCARLMEKYKGNKKKAKPRRRG